MFIEHNYIHILVYEYVFYQNKQTDICMNTADDVRKLTVRKNN